MAGSVLVSAGRLIHVVSRAVSPAFVITAQFPQKRTYFKFLSTTSHCGSGHLLHSFRSIFDLSKKKTVSTSSSSYGRIVVPMARKPVEWHSVPTLMAKKLIQFGLFIIPGHPGRNSAILDLRPLPQSIIRDAHFNYTCYRSSRASSTGQELWQQITQRQAFRPMLRLAATAPAFPVALALTMCSGSREDIETTEQTFLEDDDSDPGPH
ncbi:hypothetical protein V8D89_010046 [Ganoderma adspersum]